MPAQCAAPLVGGGIGVPGTVSRRESSWEPRQMCTGESVRLLADGTGAVGQHLADCVLTLNEYIGLLRP